MADRWWVPAAGSGKERLVNFLGAAASIAGTAFAVASIIWLTVDSQDGRMKALLVWAVGVTAFGAYMVYQLNKRDHRDIRFAKALPAAHQAHHLLRNASYARYIEQVPRKDWVDEVRGATAAMASAFSVATTAACHVTVKLVRNPNGGDGGEAASPNGWVVDTLCRSEPRSFSRRDELDADKVGDNTDFKELFSADPEKRCFHHNDLLNTGDLVYRNSHWPDRPTAKNVGYRSTMVWPIRKVVNEGADPNDLDKPLDIVVVGFLTVDSKETGIFDYSRHFEMGAAFADHLLSVVWDPELLRALHNAPDALTDPQPGGPQPAVEQG